MKHHTADHTGPWRISIVPLLALLASVVVLGGCGNSKSTSSSASSAATPPATAPATTSTSSSAPSSGLSLTANPEGQLSYDTKSLTAKAGAVAIDFTNMSSLGHNVTVESSSGATVGATPTITGESKTLSLNLKPGTYKFFCSVPGHRQAGMEGTLVVK